MLFLPPVVDPNCIETEGDCGCEGGKEGPDYCYGDCGCENAHANFWIFIYVSEVMSFELFFLVDELIFKINII